MSSNTKKVSLADKINNLITVAPTNFASDDEEDVTKAQVVEKYVESGESDDDLGGNSSMRKQNISLLDEFDERYRGEKVSRNDIYGEDNNDDDDDDDSDIGAQQIDESVTQESSQESVESGDEMNSDDGEDEDEAEINSNDDDDDDDQHSNASEDSYSDTNSNNDINITQLMSTQDTEVQKGNSVKNQIKIWENLIEMRIKLQKCLIASNKMPQYDFYDKITLDKQFLKTRNETSNSLMKLLDNLLLIQNNLLRNYPETKNLLQDDKNRSKNSNNDDNPMNEEIESETEEDEEKNEEENAGRQEDGENCDEPPKKKQKIKKSLTEYEKILEENHQRYINYRNSVIQKWNDKTRIASGKLNKDVSQPIMKQIEFILKEKSKIIQKTQLKRSEYEIVGKKSSDVEDDGRRVQEYDPEIYDDDDFYHQLLRELIEHKTAGVTDPVQLSKQWIQLQNMRTKMKRKVDTRATKGRKIRYDVHQKLVNFMAPITSTDSWTDEAKNELYNSLFGKIAAS